MYEGKAIEVDEVIESAKILTQKLAPYRSKDTSLIIHRAIRGGKKVLFEGAQGTLLDLLHGTYPYVTSSSTIAGSACVGSGVGPSEIKKVVGITKAYTTRVGSGPFPTELEDETGEQLRKVGQEFGATTGRKRRCGWLDLVALKYAIRINGITNIALMKVDVLSGFEEIKVCTGYELDGEIIREYPVSPGDLERCKPIYESLPGWTENLTETRKLEELPNNLRAYIDYISKATETTIDVVSVGPGREQTLWINPLFVS